MNEQGQKPNQQPGQGQQLPDQKPNPRRDQDLPGQAQPGQRQPGRDPQGERPDEQDPDDRPTGVEGEPGQGQRRQGGKDVERDEPDDPASERRRDDQR